MSTNIASPTRPAHVPAALEWPHDIERFAAELDDPYLGVSRMHDGPDIVWAHNIGSGRPGWVITRHEHLQQVYTDATHFSAIHNSGLGLLMGEPLRLSPNEYDPPEHTALRAVVGSWFTPGAMHHLDNRVREIAAELLDKIAERNECEFVKDFAALYPSYIFLELMKMPRDRIDDFMAWEDAVFRGTTVEARVKGMWDIIHYFEEVLDDYARTGDRGDLLSAIAFGQVEGRPIRRDEMIGTCVTFFLGGLDTVLSSLGWHFRYLAGNPALQERLQREPALIGQAVDELMRAHGVTATTRTVARDVTFHGVDMKEGDRVLLPTYLSSRDSRAYPNPHVIDIDRRGSRHLSFGTGVHTCLGIHLARRELRIAMEEWLKRFSNTRIPAGEKAEWHTQSVFGVNRLPLQFDRRTPE